MNMDDVERRVRSAPKLGAKCSQTCKAHITSKPPNVTASLERRLSTCAVTEDPPGGLRHHAESLSGDRLHAQDGALEARLSMMPPKVCGHHAHAWWTSPIVHFRETRLRSLAHSLVASDSSWNNVAPTHRDGQLSQRPVRPRIVKTPRTLAESGKAAAFLVDGLAL